MEAYIFFILLGVIGPLISVMIEPAMLPVFGALLVVLWYSKPSTILMIPIVIGGLSLILNTMLKLGSVYWTIFDFSFLNPDWVYLIQGLFVLLAILLPFAAKYKTRKLQGRKLRVGWLYISICFALMLIIPMIGGILVFFPTV